MVRPFSNPIFKGGSIAVLRGNLAPGGAIVKQAAASPALMQHEGRAVVFDSLEDLAARGDDPKQVLEALSQGLTNKLMHAPTQALNEASGEERRGLAETLSRLFRLRG